MIRAYEEDDTVVSQDGFGLAVLKPEGGAIEMDGGRAVDPDSISESKTRWIEMCYDPDEEIHSEATNIAQWLEVKFEICSMSEDDRYKIIKHLANKFVEEGVSSCSYMDLRALILD